MLFEIFKMVGSLSTKSPLEKDRQIDDQMHAYKCGGTRSAYSFSLLHVCHKWRFHQRMPCFCECMVVRATMFPKCKYCTSSYAEKRREQQNMHRCTAQSVLFFHPRLVKVLSGTCCTTRRYLCGSQSSSFDIRMHAVFCPQLCLGVRSPFQNYHVFQAFSFDQT